VLWAVEPAGDAGAPDPRPLFVWPAAAEGQPAPELVGGADVRSAARSGSDAGQLSVYGLESGGTFYGEAEQGCVIVIPLQSADQAPGPKGVCTLLVEQRSKQALQTTTALVEVIAGYIHLHSTRQQLRRTRAATASLDLAAKLIASINTAPTFKGAAFQLVNDLSRQMRADRVALGWVKGIGSSGAIRAIAVSDTELIDRRMAMIQKLEAAMDECLDQEQAVLFPPPTGEGDVLLAQAITHAHRALGASDARLKIVSLPLRDGDKVVGVVTIESTAEGPADIASIELVQAAMDLIAPVLLIRRSDDRNLASRAQADAIKAGGWLVGPKHTAWKLAVLALFVAAVLTVFIHVEYRVEAPIVLQPRSRFVVSVPFDGVISSLPPGVEAGRSVKKGDVLVEMDTVEARLKRQDALGQLNQALRESDAYLNAKPPKLAEAAQAAARADQARAKLGQADYEISQAKILSPIDGTIVAGDLSDRVGSSVKLGDVVLEVAQLKDMVVVAQVSDRDIGLVHGGDQPTTGEIATKANPGVAYPFEIERIVPLAQPKDGKNAFEVRGKLDIGDAGVKARFENGVRPGMEGIAKFNTGRHSLLWIGTRRIRDQLRLWLWW
jgi:biotin carboxyl carrier protein